MDNTPKDQKKLDILVVEDEKSLSEAITTKLNMMGINSVAFESGAAAFDYLQKLAFQAKLPDLIWLDFYVKEINGMEFMQRLKQNPHLANIPVLVVSNSANPHTVDTMMQLGAKKYILKAEKRLDEIIDIIHEIIDQDKSEKQNG